MKKSTRYSIIGFSIFVFLVLAPLLVFYVSGTTYNFDGTGTSSTGILDAKTNPSGAKVIIDGKPHSDTPAIARFLNQGEYIITLTKEGYYDWTKRLPIEAGGVTYAQEGVTEVQLVKKSEPFVIVPEGVSSFVLVGDRIWFASGNNIIHASINDPAKQTTIPIGFAARSILQLRDKSHLFLGGDTNNSLIDTQTGIVTPLPFSFDVNEASVINNVLIVKIGGILRSYDLPTRTEVILNENLSGFTMLGSSGYFIESNGTISTGIWDGLNFKDMQPILTGLNITPDNNKLVITDRKELFLIDGNKDFYRVNQTLEPITRKIEAAQLDPRTNELAVRTSSQLEFYNFLTSKSQLLTRGTEVVNTFLIHSSVGYGFVGTAKGLEMIEIDSRDQQNRYQLLSGKPVWQIAITENQKTVIALQDGALVLIDFRN